MFDTNLEKKLIAVNIAQTMIDYTSIQPDIDESKIQSAELIAQRVDLKRLIGQANVDRCIDPINRTGTIPDSDTELRELIIAPLCFFTYARCLLMFSGTFGDSGYIVEQGASDKFSNSNTAKEYRAVAETLMEEALNFLELETPKTIDKELVEKKFSPNIRTFGGNERRSSN